MTRQFDVTVEGTLPVVLANGLNTLRNIDFDSGSNSCALPAATTIGGQSVVALANITSSATTGAGFSVTGTGIYTGTGLVNFTADSVTTGVIQLVQGNGLTTGSVLSLTSTGTIVTTGEILNIAANTATTSTGILRVSATGLTTGFAQEITSGGANLTTGGALNVVNGASTSGVAVVVTSTGVMTTTAGLLTLAGASATTASGLLRITGTGLTSGLGLQITATAATLSTGRYFSANNASVEVFGIGAEGHMHTGQTTAPTIAVTQANGISAAAITAGSTDTAGIITTTGTNNNGGTTILTVTFNKTYTTAPKVVQMTGANASAVIAGTIPFVSSTTATTFVLTIPASASSGATPSFYYFVIA